MRKVLGYIDAGRREGAVLRCGGGQPVDPALAAGWFVEPTVFAGCTDDMTIVREEIFGPVMSVLTFDDEDEVVAPGQRHRVRPVRRRVHPRPRSAPTASSPRLEAGTCWINTYNITPIELPFGGYKQSGIGRENSLAAIEHYTQLQERLRRDGRCRRAVLT